MIRFDLGSLLYFIESKASRLSSRISKSFPDGALILAIRDLSSTLLARIDIASGSRVEAGAVA